MREFLSRTLSFGIDAVGFVLMQFGCPLPWQLQCSCEDWQVGPIGDHLRITPLAEAEP